MTPAGALTEFSLPEGADAAGGGITPGPDGALWFTGANKIGRITMNGIISEFPLPTPGNLPRGIVAGPDGNLWFTEFYGNRIGRLTLTGVVSEFPVPTEMSRPEEITIGRDGNLWFTEQVANKIGRVTTAGVITEFPVPGASSLLTGITAGADGNLWFTKTHTNEIGRITPSGAVTLFSIPTVYSFPAGIASGSDGNIWFTEGRRIGRLAPPPLTCTAGPSSPCLNNGRFRVEVSWRIPSQGTAGLATAVLLTADTASFWFFSSNNVELVVKVMDGQAFNNKFWVFYGALSDVEYSVTVTDTLTGRVKTYLNSQGQLASLADTTAFDGGAATVAAHPSNFGVEAPSAEGNLQMVQDLVAPGSIAPNLRGAGERVGSEALSSSLACPVLCLNDGRFRVEVTWRVPSQGTSGVGQAIPITSDTGAFWFFSPNNIELAVKVVDGRAFNNKFWVFYGALSDVEYTITVTDTTTGNVKTYFNSSGQMASVADTTAF